MAKKRPKVAEDGGAFFPPPASIVTFPSGSTLLDLVLGGGWATGGTVNVIGDSSTGKTQLATEAAANFAAKFPDAPIRYNDAESAYDESYGKRLGCPPNMSLIRSCETVEAFCADFREWAKAIPDGGRGLYILDSLDSLSDDAEMAREIGEASYGMAKAKALSEFFRKMVAPLARKGICLFVVSQVRAAVNVSYGRQTTRAGGKALTFYSLQIMYLNHVGRIEVQRSGLKRVIGVSIKAKNDKNKVGVPFREAEYDILFNFGIEDVASMIEWLLLTKQHKPTFSSEAEAKKVLASLNTMPQEEWLAWRKKLRKVVRKAWAALEKSIEPVKSKYGSMPTGEADPEPSAT